MVRCSATPRWIGTWSSSPMLVEPGNMPPEPGLSGNTLRQVVYASIGGQRLRVRFSNGYGKSSLTLNAVRLARSLGGRRIEPNSDVDLTFAGEGNARIAPGQELVSDPIDFDFEPLALLAITIQFGSTPRDITGHPGSRTTSFLAEGTIVTAAEFAAALPTEHWYIVVGIDVIAEESPGAIVTLGDSITDGRGSTTDGNNRWPDCLSRRLRGDAATNQIALLNAGIGGNSVLENGLGPTALERFERDVIRQCGTRWLVLLEGVNDIGTSCDSLVAKKLIFAYEHFIAIAHRYDILAYGVPLLPFGGSQYYSLEHEQARQVVNTWIRSSGKFDAVIDLDAAVRDPEQPTRLCSVYDGGDHLHLSPAGLARMADAIDLALFCTPNLT